MVLEVNKSDPLTPTTIFLAKLIMSVLLNPTIVDNTLISLLILAGNVDSSVKFSLNTATALGQIIQGHPTK